MSDDSGSNSSSEANMHGKLEETRMRRQFDNLARVARTWADEGRPRPRAPGWLALQRAMRRRKRAANRTRVLGGAMLGVAAVAVLILLRSPPRSEPGLTFVVSGGELPAGARTTAAGGLDDLRPTTAPARLAFSDGSDVVLQPGARGRVVATSARGARVRLDAGRARFAITHRADTEWSVAAGPFTVLVHGTVFDVGWSVPSGELEVGLLMGAVTVRGPVPGGVVAVKPGQRLIARASTGWTQIDALATASPAVSPLPSSTTAEAAAATPDQTPPGAGEPLLPAGIAGDAPRGGRPRSGADAVGHRAGYSRPTPARGAAAVREVSATWAARVASGAFLGVVTDANGLGMERCLAQAPASALAALADAARYVRRTDLARRALLAERRRFPGTTDAHNAAFLIGRLADDAAGDPREALLWYDRYLDEAAPGTYAAEVLGRKMLALDRLGRTSEARAAATAYLAAFPEGPHAVRAAGLRARR